MSRIISILILLISCSFISAQSLEAESRPYRFNIDHEIEYVGVTTKNSYHISPYRNEIRDQLEQEIEEWYLTEGNLLTGDPTYNERIIQEIEKRSPIIIHQLGEKTLKNCNKDCYLITQKLELEIVITDFKPFRIEIPLADVESFKNNFKQLNFGNENITFSDEDEFVVTYTEISNPVNGKKYYFHNPADESIKTPSFNIHLPGTDL